MELLKRVFHSQTGTPKLSLRHQILTWLTWVAISALLSIGGISEYLVFRTEQNAWRDRQREAAYSAADTVSHFMERAYSNLNQVSLSNREYLQDNPNFLTDLITLNPELLELIRLDSSGQVRFSAAADKPLLANQFTIPQSQWFITARDGQKYQGNVRISYQNEPYLVISMPAVGGDVVAARVKMNFLQNAVSRIHFGQAGRAFVLNSDGQIIAHPDPEVVMANTNLSGNSRFEALLSSADKLWNGEFVNLEGTLSIGSTAPIENTQWIIVTELPFTEAHQQSLFSLVMLVIWLLIYLAAIAFFSTRTLDRIVFNPIGRLKEGAEKIGQGELDYRINLKQEDEIGQVARSFDLMAGRLEDREQLLTAHSQALMREIEEHKETAKDLQVLTEELEERVRNRTIDLEKEIERRHRAEQELWRSLDRLLLVNRVISSGTSTLEPERVLEILCTEVAQAIRVPSAVFMAPDEHDRLCVVSEYNERGEAANRGMEIPILANSTFRQVLDLKMPLTIEDIRTHQDLKAIRPLQTWHNIIALLIVPLVIRQQVVGVLALGTDEIRQFTPDEVSLAQFVATAAGQAYENARLYKAVQRELGERKSTQEQLVYQSTHDALTGLFNRGFFETEIHRLENSRQFPISIVMVDVDRLKYINDTFGHLAGDELLQRSANLLKEAFRAEDIVARIGGDEFCILLVETSMDQVQRIMDRVRLLVSCQVMPKGMPPLSLSLGCATAQPGQNLMETFKMADEQMYQEKAKKRAQN